MKALLYLLVGMLFGITLWKSEAASWFRIYEMFTFGSFHMYGIIGSALVLGILMVQWVKSREIRSINGSPIFFHDKNKSYPRYIMGGIIFGMGWALTGACPGPMFAIAGAGYYSIFVVIAFSVLGTFLYGLYRHKLPH